MTGNSRRGVIIQPRDTKLLAAFAVLRVLTHQQAQIVGGFGSYQRPHARLSRLMQSGILNRYFLATEAGGRKSVYSLSLKGAKLIGTEQPRLAGTRNRLTLGDTYTLHRLKINDFYLAIFNLPLPRGIASVERWRSFGKPLSPACLLTPDGYFEVRANEAFRCMFVEIDLGTETGKMWEGKVRHYLNLAVSGEFCRVFAREQFRVLIVAPSIRRIEGIRKIIQKHTDKIFWLTTFEAINQSGIWASIWLRPNGAQTVPLI